MKSYKNMSKEEKTVFWQEHISRQESSELPIIEYCAEKNISRKTFSTWKKKLREKSDSSLIQVPLIEVNKTTASESSIEIIINDNTYIRVKEKFNSSLLKSIIEVLS